MKTGDIGCVVLDLDGTLYHAGSPIPGAAEAVQKLRAAGLPLRFVTNTFATPPWGVAERLRGYGFEVGPGELFSPHRAFEEYLGFLREDRPDLKVKAFVNPRLRAFMEYLPPEAEGRPDVLLVGDADELWSYEALDRLVDYLIGGAEFLASSPSRSFVGREGRIHIDTGSLVALLEAASGKHARTMGKPSADFSRIVAKSANVTPGRLLFVGDDPAVDMAAAKAVSAPSVLVETGKGATARQSPKPDEVIASLAALPALLGLR